MMFSIIVPCYNAQEYLRKCIESIMIQTYKDFELIVIDDGSTDNTSSILEEYTKMYSNMKVYHFENSGVSLSRRRGITLSSGKYVIFVDSDDTINPNLLYELSKTINKYDYPDIIRYQTNLINDLPDKNHERYNYRENCNKVFRGLYILKLWTQPEKKYAIFWLFAFKKNIFANILFATELRCYEDVALIPILIAISGKIVTIDFVGYNHTCNNNNSLTNIKTIEAERSRAIDFVEACKYAILNFCNLSNITFLDKTFFIEDYFRRIQEKYESLPENLKVELKDYFDF